MVPERDTTPITDPAMVLLGLGALVACFAGVQWLRLFRLSRDLHKADSPGTRARDTLALAALSTSAALFLCAGGFLLGRLTGRL